jgi:hypothetical protein
MTVDREYRVLTEDLPVKIHCQLSSVSCQLPKMAVYNFYFLLGGFCEMLA